MSKKVGFAHNNVDNVEGLRRMINKGVLWEF